MVHKVVSIKDSGAEDDKNCVLLAKEVSEAPILVQTREYSCYNLAKNVVVFCTEM